MLRTLLLSLCLGILLATGATTRADEKQVSFSRVIQPILAKHCYACHGPDEEQREGELRLDRREAAVESGAIVPGKPKESELVRRIFTRDPDERMPPADAKEKLSDKQKELLRLWITEGAEYQRHWAFVPPQRPPVPDVSNSADWRSWPKNPIDNFVLDRLLREGLTPSTAADRYTLVRRVYLDLIGLPPTIEEADAFVNDKDPKAYEKLVDRLLKSPRYGERWARLWLDLARYADTNGYEKDRPRSIWPYRDWVIKALNDDMPFDRFTVEQLAGDMLPEATASQKIATGFHRNTMLNEEGGIDPLEYRFYAMVDRVATTGTIWLGLTTGCGQCHSHKYDPFTQTDYYRMMALLNNADEPDMQVPDLSIAQRRKTIEGKIARLEKDLPQQFPPAKGDGDMDQRRHRHLEEKFSRWLNENQKRAVAWQVMRPSQMKTNLPRLEVLPDGSIFSTGDITKRDVFTLTFSLDGLKKRLTALRLEVLPDPRLPASGPGRAYYEGRKGDFFLSEVTATAAGKKVPFASASHSYGKISIGSGGAKATNVIDGEGSTGWATAGREGEAHRLVLNFAQPLKAKGELKIEMLFERHFAASLGRFRYWASGQAGEVKALVLPVDVEQLLATYRESWTDEQFQQVRQYYLGVAPELAAARKQIDALRKQLPAYPTTMVMRERPADNPRQTFRHHRGEYLSPREEVTPGIPAAFTSADDKQPPRNRLEFARWLVSDGNPMVGRVTVNRAWRAFFGAGLVHTGGDYGTQSAPPTHPLLLDWLATELASQKWSLKKLHRLIVTSATYRQSSHVTASLLDRDPNNRLLARGGRYRIDAEMVRDAMLRSSGLLSPKMYGPSVFPPQPASVTALAYGNTRWNVSKGEDRYRRSLYTFSKRTAPFAAFGVFDAPTGENCVARRNRSNTPLQALTLLNDEMYLEMARALAAMAVKESAITPQAQATYIFRRLLTRPPSADELAALVAFQQAQQKRLASGELKTAQIAGQKNANAETASWVLVARAVMNLDEAITRP